MKLLFIILFSIFFYSTSLYSQTLFQDVVEMKDGNIVKGKIIPSESDSLLLIKNLINDTLQIYYREIKDIGKEKYHIIDGKKIIIYKNPGFAGFMSIIIPGSGQYYNGDALKGVLQQVMVYGGFAYYLREHTFVSPNSQSGLSESIVTGIILAGYLWSVIDAPISAIRINYERSGYGHFIEHKTNSVVFGIDILNRKKSIQSQFTLHF